MLHQNEKSLNVRRVWMNEHHLLYLSIGLVENLVLDSKSRTQFHIYLDLEGRSVY